MSLLFGRRRQERRDGLWPDGGGWGPLDGSSAQTLSERRMLSLSYCYAAVAHISDFGSTLPLKFFRAQGDLRQPMGAPQLFARLQAAGRLGPWLSQMFTSMVVDGSAVGLVRDIDGMGFPSDVLWLPRRYYSVDDSVIGSPRWFVNGYPVREENLIHIPWVSVPGRTLGLSPIEYFAASVNAGSNAQNHASRWFKNGGFPPALFKNSKQVVPPDQAEAISERLQSRIAGGAPLVIGNDWEFEAVMIPPNQAAFIETMNASATQIAAMYGIDPQEIGGPAEGGVLHYTTDEGRQIKRAQNLRKYVVKVEQVLNAHLPAPQNVAFDIDASYRADMKTRFEAYQAALNMGILSRNEIRVKEDLPPIPGGDDYTPQTGNLPGSDKQPAALSTPNPPPSADQPDDPARRLSIVSKEEA